MGHWLKRAGRWWVILTDEDRHLDPQQILAILIVQWPGERHLSWAVQAARRRFPRALITVLTPGDAAVEQLVDPLLEVRRLPGRRYAWQLCRQLRRWRQEQLSAILLLSLHPLTAALACLDFRCNRLVFNRWGQWFCLRQRTVTEALTLRPGADRGGTWDGAAPRVRAMCTLGSWLGVPWRLLIQIGRAGGLALQIGLTLAVLYGKRWRYQWSRRRHAMAGLRDDMSTGA